MPQLHLYVYVRREANHGVDLRTPQPNAARQRAVAVIQNYSTTVLYYILWDELTVRADTTRGRVLMTGLPALLSGVFVLVSRTTVHRNMHLAGLARERQPYVLMDAQSEAQRPLANVSLDKGLLEHARNAVKSDLAPTGLEATAVDTTGAPDVCSMSEPPLEAAIIQFNRLLVSTMKTGIDVIFSGRDFARFYVLETLARVPYFAYVSCLHLFETLGAREHVHRLRTHYAEAGTRSIRAPRPLQPRLQLRRMADVCLVPLRTTPLRRRCVPSIACRVFGRRFPA